MSAAPATPVLTVRNAQKRFGAVHALRDVSFSAFRGEVVALLGDNGAGKSTLVKCISGVYALDEGDILLDGVTTVIHSPAIARRAGIETVYQDLALFDNLTPAQNFYCGREIAFPTWLPLGLRLLEDRAMDREAAAVLDRLKVELPRFRRARRRHVGRSTAGDRGRPCDRVRAKACDSRRADRRSRRARVAQGSRPDLSASG